MPDEDKNFTEATSLVMRFAREEAQRFQHTYIGTEHILLGLIRKEDGYGAKALESCGVELSKARSAVEFIIGRGILPLEEDIGLTPRSKRVIELAQNEARRMDDEQIDTEHLLLGLVRDGEGIASGILESLGVELDRARTAVYGLRDRLPDGKPVPWYGRLSSAQLEDLRSDLEGVLLALRNTEALYNQVRSEQDRRASEEETGQ